MTDNERPLFFGGLPPRGGVALLERSAGHGPDQPVASASANRWNRLAIVAFVASFVISIVGICCGAIALRQIKRSGERGRTLAFVAMILGTAGIAIFIALVGVLAVGGFPLVSQVVGLSAPAPTSYSFPTSRPVSAAEAAAAKAAIASGGGAIAGHIVSGELCTAVKNFSAINDGAPHATQLSPQQLAAMEQLAAVKSPNQQVYQSFVAMKKDPASVPSIQKAQSLSADFAKAVQIDVATCL